jgi:SAM-dependent methyltransferase
MLKLPSKSLEPADYAGIHAGLRLVYRTLPWLGGRGIRPFIPHPHRHWEYGSLAQAFLDWRGPEPRPVRALDVGCGFGLLGPMLALAGAHVTEIDPEPKVAGARAELAAELTRAGFVHQFLPVGLDKVTGTFDAVFSVSVMEHLEPEAQPGAWAKLAALVRPGGLLAVTVDFGPAPWQPNKDRETCFAPDDVSRIAGWLTEAGITLTSLDLAFHGPQINEYTFFRILGVRA